MFPITNMLCCCCCSWNDGHRPPMAVLTGLGSFGRCKYQIRSDFQGHLSSHPSSHPSFNPSSLFSCCPTHYFQCQDCSAAPTRRHDDLQVWSSSSPSSCCCEAHSWHNIFWGAPAAGDTQQQLLRHGHRGWLIDICKACLLAFTLHEH